MASPSSAPEYISKVRDAYTPFRLPKLYPMGEDDQSPPSESVASFFPGHEYLTPSPDLLNYRMSGDLLQMSGSPLRVPVKSSFDYPRLKHAIIAPKAAITFTKSGRPQLSRYENFPVRSRIVRPQTALSDTGSIHWALGTKESVNFDHTGRCRQQGPYSRSFTKKCMAPPNWVKMKYGRSNTFVS